MAMKLVLQRGQVACRASSSRSAVSRIKPFQGSRVQPRHFVATRAAEPAGAASAEFEEQPLIQDEEEVAEERVVLDDDARLALQTAQEVMATFALEAVIEAEMVEEGDEDAEAILSRAADLVESGLDAASGPLDRQTAAAALLVADSIQDISVLKEDEIEDFQSAAGFFKYDEEEMNAVTEEQRAAVAPLKLTRQELSSLVPQDWSTLNVDWFTNKKDENVPLPEYRLTFLWQEKNIGVAVDQVYSRGQTSPLTGYFFWPRKDAWDQLQADLATRSWVTQRDQIVLLNKLTEVINYWQDNTTKHSVEEARAAFKDCTFA